MIRLFQYEEIYILNKDKIFIDRFMMLSYEKFLVINFLKLKLQIDI